jgi:hypothetical protein
MTDHIRFRPIYRETGQRYRQYHGAPIADFVLRLADWWLSLRRRHRDTRSRTLADRRRPSYPGPIAASIFAVLAFVSGSPQAFAQEAVRLRGTIEEMIADDGYVIRTRDDKIVRLRLAAKSSIAASVKSSLSDIRPGIYIGIAAIPQADGTLRALEAHIFDESMRGTAEGHRSWDLLPKSTMTNAVVQDIVSAVDGHAVTLRYKDGHQQVLIPADTAVVTYLPGSIAELKPGAAIFIPGAALQSDGTFVAQRIMVGRDIAPPQ